jgi:iron(III) transport system ATP-binding protein
MTPRLTVSGLCHRYGTNEVLSGIDLTVAAGEVVCLLGPSGAGKTTVLRLVAGLEPVQAGEIAIDGRVVACRERSDPPERRKVGLVFQDAALFPHLTVAGNIAFGLRGRDRRARVAEWLARVGLAGFERRYPHTLSGGQQQRVALARALAPSPAVLLLDEPFAALDADRREQVREEALALLRAAGVATLLVTHDAEEAMAVGDRIALLADGRVLQIAPPRELYQAPVNQQAAAALGRVSVLPGVVADGVLVSALGRWPVEALLRPEWLRLAPAEGDGGWRVTAVRFQGPLSLAFLEANGPPIVVALAPAGLQVGERVTVSADPTCVRVVPATPRPAGAPGSAKR